MMSGRPGVRTHSTHTLQPVDSQRKTKTYGRYLRTLLTLVDWGLVNLFFAITLLLVPPAHPDAHTQKLLWVILNVSFLPVILWSSRNRNALRAIQIDRVMLQSLSAGVIHALFFLSLNGFLGLDYIGEKQYVLYYGMLLVAFALWSIVSHWSIKVLRRRGFNYTRVVIVGTNDTARRLYENMLSDTGFGYRVLGFFSTEPVPEYMGVSCYPVWELDKFVRTHRVDQIYYTVPGRDELLAPVVKIADDNVTEFFYVPQISRYISRGFELHNIGSMPVLTIRRNPLSKPVNSAVKRTFDIVFSSVFLCVYPLIYVPIAIAIKLTSPGPVYFKQERTGYRGRKFTCLKFRTMHVNRDADRAQATADDPRKTRLGDFLRRTSLDELPQFINVWRGDMSVVGPRPHMLKHTEDYSKLVDRYMVRHLIRPGITGWAQVNGYRGMTDELWKMEKRVENDVWYIEHWTLALDLKIIVRTIINAVKGESNAF